MTANEMSQPARELQAPDTTDQQRILRHARAAVLKRFAVRGGIGAVAFLVQPLTGVTYLIPLTVAAAAYFMFELVRFLSGLIWARLSGRVLREYRLEMWPRVIEREKGWILHGTVFLLSARGPEGKAPRMRAIDAVDSGDWPASAVDGVWVAGDPLFGGVMIVPGTDRILFMQPSKWNEMAAERKQAGAERIAKAKRARIDSRWPRKSAAY
ncbi:hypothetical protein [Streptomyces sp. NPDC050738]|uniref:hypothetical protein n=1 Tax=Streptomyces sp. NPDC050738 TaxID=3154744 RepID=UPI003429FD1A